MLIDTLRAYSKIMSEKKPRCYKKATKLSLLYSALKTMQIKGDFDNCPACKFMMESKDIDSSKLNLCIRCSHLYEEGKYMKGNHSCKCWKVDYLFSYRHVIETCVPAVCPYCKSENIEYQKDIFRPYQHHNIFIIDESRLGYYIIKCLNCNRKSKEYYKIEFESTEGI